MLIQEEFRQALVCHQEAFHVELSARTIDRLYDYYELVRDHNSLLHLVGPCSAEEFAVRHILESLFLLTHLPPSAKFADIGPGAGLPSIPCLIACEDLSATLIESKVKKGKFLDHAVGALGLADRATIVNRQFEEAAPGDAAFVTCRALDKFSEKLPRLVTWSGGRQMLLFGGNAVRDILRTLALSFTEELLPLSERRYLFTVASRGW